MDNQTLGGVHSTEVPELIKTKETQNETALTLRQIRSNLSPICKPPNQCEAMHTPPLLLERPPHITNRSCVTLQRNSLQANDEEISYHIDEANGTSAAKGPPPLPPKPKVLPTKPSNWGANNSD